MGDTGPDALIELPTDEYEIEDALWQVRVKGIDDVMVGLEQSCEFEFLCPYIKEVEDLRALNALAVKLWGISVKSREYKK